MSKNLNNLLQRTILLAAVFVLAINAFGQSDEKKEEIVADAKVAKAEFIKADPKMANLVVRRWFTDFPNAR